MNTSKLISSSESCVAACVEWKRDEWCQCREPRSWSEQDLIKRDAVSRSQIERGYSAGLFSGAGVEQLHRFSAHRKCQRNFKSLKKLQALYVFLHQSISLLLDLLLCIFFVLVCFIKEFSLLACLVKNEILNGLEEAMSKEWMEHIQF